MSDPILVTLPVIGVFVGAGLLWAGSGILKNIIKHLKFKRSNPATTDPNWTGVQTEAVKSDVILGTGLGLLAFFVNAYNGNVTIDFTTIQALMAGLVTAYGAVALVDNTIVEPFLSS